MSIRLSNSVIVALYRDASCCVEAGGVFFVGVHAWLVLTFNYLILWVRVKGQG